MKATLITDESEVEVTKNTGYVKTAGMTSDKYAVVIDMNPLEPETRKKIESTLWTECVVTFEDVTRHGTVERIDERSGFPEYVLIINDESDV